MKVSFFGSGNMTRVIAGALSELGHEVYLGSRSPEKAQEIAAEIGQNARGGSNDEAAIFGDIVFHSVRDVPSTFINKVSSLDGKILVDLNNRDFPREFKGSEIVDSLASAVQRDLPLVKVVKALNNQAMEALFPSPQLLHQAGIQSFICGDDEDAKKIVSEMLISMGLKPVDFGSLQNAWLLEVQADILRTYMFATGNFLATPGFLVSPSAPARFGERRKGAY